MARQLRKRSQEWLSEEVGVKQSSVSGWETGKTDPTTENMSRIARVLDVNFEWLAKGTGSMTGASSKMNPPSISETQKICRYYTDEQLEILNLIEMLPKSKRLTLLNFVKDWIR